MKTKILLLILSLLFGYCCGQKSPDTYNNLYKVSYGNNKAIKFSSKNQKKELKEVKKINIVYDKNADLLSFQNDSIYKKIKDSDLTSNVLLRENFEIAPLKLRTSIKLKKDTLQYFIWKYSCKNDKRNAFLENNIIYEKIDKGNFRNLRSKMFYIGAMTIPIKWYLGGKGDTLSDSRIKFNANVGVTFGYKIQWNRVSNLWGEDELKVTAKTGISHNVIFGINQTEFSKDNNFNFIGDKKQSVPAVSLAYGFAYHINSLYLMGTFGFDIPLSNKNNGWKYQGVPWAGFGIGFGLESIGIGNGTN